MNSPIDAQTPVSATTFARGILVKYPKIEWEAKGGYKLEFRVPKDLLRDLIKEIEDEFDDAFPEMMFGVDLGDDQYEVVYIFWSAISKALLEIHVQLSGSEPSIESVADIFPGLEWHERETWEMFGINFHGHPDLRLLLLPDELEGKYPLRKSFETDRSRLDERGLDTRPPPKPDKGGEQG